MSGRLEDWLAGLGLSRYVEAFAAQAIDLDVLGELSESDLRDLGIPLGDRKRLLKAISAGLPQSAASRDEAERELRTALDVAGSQGARMLSLRAATALARLLADSHRRSQALELLRPAYAAITEGHDTADLVAARLLLDALS